ncbi:MAG: hypothetical protein ACXAEU_21005 [Candidatus Hodarchaeales archaeon]|jgi:hypothetical protein
MAIKEKEFFTKDEAYAFRDGLLYSDAAKEKEFLTINEVRAFRNGFLHSDVSEEKIVLEEKKINQKLGAYTIYRFRVRFTDCDALEDSLIDSFGWAPIGEV